MPEVGGKYLWVATDTVVTILGPEEDPESYYYNRPGDEWELIKLPDGREGWIPFIRLVKL